MGMKPCLFWCWWWWGSHIVHSCRTTRSCIIGPYHQGCLPDSIEKDSWSARRADCSRQRLARLHTTVIKKNHKMTFLSHQCCRTSRSCRHKALQSSSRPDSIKKDSWSACRADRSRQRQAKLHTVWFGFAEGRRPDGQPTWGVCPRASSLCGTWVTRGRIDGWVEYMAELKENEKIVRDPPPTFWENSLFWAAFLISFFFK